MMLGLPLRVASLAINSVNPSTAFNGVRNSWFMLEMKLSLARLACSARSSATA